MMGGDGVVGNMVGGMGHVVRSSRSLRGGTTVMLPNGGIIILPCKAILASFMTTYNLISACNSTQLALVAQVVA